MGGQKMEITKESLKLFIQSLPEGSQFQIISFGSKFEAMRQLSTDSCIFDYNDENAKFAQQNISGMDANFGGTNIFSPMKDVLENKNSNAFKVGD